MAREKNEPPIVIVGSTPEEFAERLAERLRNLNTRPALQGRKEPAISEEHIAEMKKSTTARCVPRGHAGDPQVK